MIKIKNITFAYKNQKIFKDFNLEIREEETTLITGINGTGKTTLLRLMAGVLNPHQGEIEYSKELGKNPKAKIGFISDQMHLYENMKLTEAMNFHSRVYNINDFDKTLFEQTKLYMNKKISELSAGQKLIFHLGLLIAVNPQVLLIDEVIHSIDPFLREVFLNQLLKLIEEKKITLILVNQNFHDIENILQRVILLRNGKIAIDEPIEKLKEKVKKVISTDESINLPVFYKREFSDCNEYYIYPFNKNESQSINGAVKDLNLHEIIKAFIGGEYV